VLPNTQRDRFAMHQRVAALASALAVSIGAASGTPVVVVDRDNIVITQSCVVRIPSGLIIPDSDNNGVIQVDADNVRVEFEPGSELRGRSLIETAEQGWDTLTGRGITIEGRRGVRVVGARVHGYKAGLVAREADLLTIQGGDFSDNFRQKLGSTPQSEDGGDWMSPHRNDQDQWLTNYGAAIYITRSERVRVEGVTVRRGQNGICLDEVSNSRIYDNDASFLSGWGLAMFRSSGNVITRNAFDFCVRGHSEGVYNRGQDSAGILMFEQCSGNIVANNSATHGGDGIFGFGGLDALEVVQTPRAGCNDNIFVDNDLSFAPAHGLEMTFSFGNIIARNIFEENAITGVWGGFSQDTLIAQNDFIANGGMPYGEERGGVNIEHGIGNRVLDNVFDNNMKGVHFWYDNPGTIPGLPWGQRNYGPLAGNVIAGNLFHINDDPQAFPGRNGWTRYGIDLRSDSGVRFTGLQISQNTWDLAGSLPQQVRVVGNVSYSSSGSVPAYTIPSVPDFGTTNPVNARPHLRGRENIIMGEWGPWHHEGLFVRRHSGGSGEVYEVFGASPDAGAVLTRGSADVTLAPWPALRNGPTSAPFSRPALDMDYAWGGPPDFGMGSSSQIGSDYFGFEGVARVSLTPGVWRMTTASDDGIRVTVDGQSVIENFDWHPPETDVETFTVTSNDPVEIRVLHFEIDGYAWLTLDLEPVDAQGGTVCRTDRTLDGRIDFGDVLELLDATDAGRPDADFVPDGELDEADITAFLARVAEGGC